MHHMEHEHTRCFCSDRSMTPSLNGFYNIDEHTDPMMSEPRQTSVSCTFTSPPAEVSPIDAVCVFLQNFLNSSSCPEIQGYLHLKEPGRKSWKKLYMFLRRSGLYYSTKGTSKVIDYEYFKTCMKTGGDSLPHPPSSA